MLALFTFVYRFCVLCELCAVFLFLFGCRMSSQWRYIAFLRPGAEEVASKRWYAANVLYGLNGVSRKAQEN